MNGVSAALRRTWDGVYNSEEPFQPDPVIPLAQLPVRVQHVQVSLREDAGPVQRHVGFGGPAVAEEDRRVLSQEPEAVGLELGILRWSLDFAQVDGWGADRSSIKQVDQ